MVLEPDLNPTFATRTHHYFQGRILADVLLEDSMNQKVINIFPYVTRCTLDIILETAMGVQLGIQHARKSEYLFYI